MGMGRLWSVQHCSSKNHIIQQLRDIWETRILKHNRIPSIQSSCILVPNLSSIDYGMRPVILKLKHSGDLVPVAEHNHPAHKSINY
jgi:hypothetical protein